MGFTNRCRYLFKKSFPLHPNLSFKQYEEIDYKKTIQIKGNKMF